METNAYSPLKRLGSSPAMEGTYWTGMAAARTTLRNTILSPRRSSERSEDQKRSRTEYGKAAGGQLPKKGYRKRLPQVL